MRNVLVIGGVVAAILLGLGAGKAGAASATDVDPESIGTLDQARPAWLTDSLEAEILAAGPKGVEVKFAPNAAFEPPATR